MNTSGQIDVSAVYQPWFLQVGTQKWHSWGISFYVCEENRRTEVGPFAWLLISDAAKLQCYWRVGLESGWGCWAPSRCRSVDALWLHPPFTLMRMLFLLVSTIFYATVKCSLSCESLHFSVGKPHWFQLYNYVLLGLLASPAVNHHGSKGRTLLH